MIHWLYERFLVRGLMVLPAHICFMITEHDMQASPGKLAQVTAWCRSVNLQVSRVRETPGDHREDSGDAIIRLIFHISTPDPARILPCLPAIREVAQQSRLSLHIGELTEVSGKGIEVCVAVGMSGREEIASCIRRMALDGIPPTEVSEETFEQYLTFPYTPDLVIKTGGYHLTDFLIWQGVYSELFFSDVNWEWFRKTDFLRALRDYQARVRRFGR